MRTKHLFLATALVASFAACSNEDLFEAPQNVAKDGRPTVSDVKLNFTGDADTRLTFGSTGYAWESTDVIGALLMDKVNTLDANKTWLEKYTLTEFIHTSYPFTYNTEDKTWGCNAKMLEGNYFFAFPWESYDGERKVKHSLINQQQNGVKGSVVAESYAKNQFFIGYSQIKAGKNAKDVLNDVEMTSVLGAIQLRIVNTGTQTYHINKIVLSGSGLSSELTFDPTNAAYGAYTHSGNVFNYANYTDNKTDLFTAGGAYVYSADENYNRLTALRAVVNKSSTDKSAQLVINGTAEERALVSTKVDEKAIAYALIMANPHTPATGDLKLSIYTDEGMVSGIDLTKINESSSSSYIAITDSKVEKIASDVNNTIKVQIDDNSFVVPTSMDIYNSEDLLQFIKWNARVSGTRNCVATIEEDVTLTKEMVDLLKASTNVTLKIDDAAGEHLVLAEDVPADVLDYDKLTITADIDVTGSLALTAASDNVTSITVKEGATLTVNDVNAVIPASITNDGMLAFGAESKVANTKTITNNGTMTVDKGGDVKAYTTNNGTLNDNGYVQNVTNEGTIVMGADAILMASTNGTNGVIATAKNAQVSLSSNAGEVKYVAGAIVSAGGTISTEISGALNKNTFANAGCTITKLVLKAGITSVTDDLSYTNVVVSDGAELSVAAGKTLTVTNLTIEGAATLKGAVNPTTLTVEEGAALTIAKDAVMNVTYINNDGIVYNNGKVVTSDATVGAWKYNDPVAPTAPAVTKQDVMDAAVAQWAKYWDVWDPSIVATYYGFTPYEVTKFIATMDVWVTTPDTPYGAAAKNLKDKWCDASNIEADELSEVLVDASGNAVAEFNTAVGKVLTAANLKTLKQTIIASTGAFQNITITADATAYNTQTLAYNSLRKFIAEPANVTGISANSVAATAWKLTDAEIETALSKDNNKYKFIWKANTCPLYEVMQVVNTLTAAEWNSALATSGSAVNTIAGIQALLKAAYTTDNSNAAANKLKALAEKYYPASNNWAYTDDQVDALN